jgi:metallo-beta-lactamase family protein
VKEGFDKQIFCTPGTKDLTAVLLQDSADIQRDDTEFMNKRRSKQGLPPLSPLYDLSDVEKTLPLFIEKNYDEWFEIENGIEVMFTDAGHIIGSAAVHVRINENGKLTQMSFSGDVGRYGDVILRSPSIFSQADYIIIESTYGDSLHENVLNTSTQLMEWIDKTCNNKKGKLIIPAFSVGRTQELLYFLNELSNENKLPAISVFVDSPLSKEATEVVKNHPENFNKTIQQLLQTDNDPFDFPGLKFVETVEESKSLNNLQEPCIIISASGMADAGRIKHHLMNNINDEKNTILIVGYCEPNSLGGRLMNGEKSVRIFGEDFNVVAEVGVMRSMSAHGDYNDLCRFLECQNSALIKKLFIVHGEYKVQQEFQKRLLTKGFKTVEVPALHEVFGEDY